MKQLLSLSNKKLLLITLSVLLVGFVATRFMVAEAVSTKTVGSISVIHFVPNAGANGIEFVTLQYAGPGEADLSGWTIASNAGTVFSFGEASLPSGQLLKVCGEGIDSSCGLHWSGKDSFNDDGDTLSLYDETGLLVASITYPSSTTSTDLQAYGDYTTEVYGKSDKVVVCHADGKGGFRQQNVNASNIVRSEESAKSGHATHPDDIIPSFVHEFGTGFGFYAGNSWPDKTGVYAGDCN